MSTEYEPHFEINAGLLSGPEEKALGHAIIRGKQAFNSLSNGQNLSPEQVKQLEIDLRQGKEARTQFILANTGLVVSRALKLVRKNQFSMDLFDAIQSGHIGLIKAVDHYNPDFESRFSTYAVFWIEREIRHALANDQSVPKPIGFQIELKKFNHLISKMRQSDSKITPEIIAGSLGINLKEAILLMQSSQFTVSLDDPINLGSSVTRGDFIPNPDLNTEKTAIQNLTTEDANQKLQILTPRQQLVLRMLCGFGNRDPKTQEEIAKALGVSKQYISQIIKAARKVLIDALDDIK